MSNFSVSGTLLDPLKKEIYPGTVTVENGKISHIQKDLVAKSPHYILPGFIDAHIHIESSMLIPSEFARLATLHGTVATVSDPHEIGNVLGIAGVRYMIENGKQVPFHFYFGAPSCVPATSFETSGACINAKEILDLFQNDSLKYLSEMMNYPGVIHSDPVVMEKIKVAQAFGLPIDGHAPGLRGKEMQAYIRAGISTDHECMAFDEALDKIQYGMQILIREGSAAKNYEALHPLIALHPDKLMFCSDDKHPDELVLGHINELVKRSIIKHGYDLLDVLKIACVNPVLHYKLEVGLLQEGDFADFIVIDNPINFNVLETYIKGSLVAKDKKSFIASVAAKTPNHFHTHFKNPKDFIVKATKPSVRAIVVEDGQLVTQEAIVEPAVVNGCFVSTTQKDLLKVAVINRYKECAPALGFVKNFGLKKGALASCIAHDSHNIIAVGCSDEDICKAVNLIMKHKGGIAVVDGPEELILPLPVAGIMTNEEGSLVAKKYEKLDAAAKLLGSHLKAPFMTLSFMALLVIPKLKLSDLGLFDGEAFDFVSLEL